MRQGSEHQLVEAGADVSILPERDGVLCVCMTEVCKELRWSKVCHNSSLFASVIEENIYKKNKQQELRLDTGLLI